MALPWHIPLETAPSLKEKVIPPQPSLLKHYCNLKIHENPIEELQTGIMCNIGMDNREPTAIQRLIACGMTVARLEMRDFEPDVCAQLIQSIRQAVYNYSAELQYVYPLALIMDVRGPSIVTGSLKSGTEATIELVQNNSIRLTSDISWQESGTSDCLFVGYDNLINLQCEDVIYIDSLSQGKIKLIVSNVGDDSVECTIVVGGIIGPKMTVRIVQVPQERENLRNEKGDSLQTISCSETSQKHFEHMDDQIAWAIGADVDALLVPSVQYSYEVRQVKDILSEKGKHILVFASIETVLGLDNIDDILKEADGIYLDRCVLSTDLAIEKIFMAHKVILAKCNYIGKPCICKAVINEQIPTLSVTDIANLVIDGVDVISLELRYNSPLSKFSKSYDPIRMAEHCLAAAAVVSRQAEHALWQPRIYGNLELMQSPLEEPTKAVCISAVELAMRSQAVVILCLTNSGRTAKILSHAKPPCPIVAVTRICHTGRQLRFWRGVRTVHYFEVVGGNWNCEVEARVRAALDYCKTKRILRAGDAYITVTGSRRGGGYCDSVRLLYASARETVIID
ncbi:unnamed protein product [Chilo suppressalis]|uniref:Pyruvate kinase n=1 Tax=Chilo suppressalis TaxID=168631 RepID=A0ABN8B5Y4_CHISP|nr:unnamed protein product [Chilo suppressalis]